MVVERVVCFFFLCFLLASSVNSDGEVSDGDKEAVNCLAEKKAGPCFGYFPKWFFNQTSNKCTEFIYGGCQGNGNNFESEEECKMKCLVHFRKNDELSFSHDGPINPKGPCTTALGKEKLLRAIIIHGAGRHFGYTPDCDAEGFYKPMQCKHHMKRCCWCVDRWGNRIKSSKGRRTRGHPDELDCGTESDD